MNIEWVTGELRAGEMLAGRIEAKLSKLEHRLGEKFSPRVRLSSHGASQFACTVQVLVHGQPFSAQGEGGDLVKAADEALGHLERQLHKVLSRAQPERDAMARAAALG